LFVDTQSSRLIFFTHTVYRSGNLFVYPLAAELLQYGTAQPPIFTINI